MKISSTLQPLLDPDRRELPSLLQQLKVGQVLPARVLAELQPGLLRLQIATTELLARSQVRLAAGTTLRLEVVKNQAVPELRILLEPTPRGQRDQAVRSAMARQLPLAEVRQAVTALRTEPLTTQQADSVRQLARVLQEAGVAANQLNATQLQRAVSLSGLFHEARLAAGAPAEPADVKTRLLQLLATLNGSARTLHGRATPPPPAESQQARTGEIPDDTLLNRLMRLVEGSVARIQLQQTTALPGDETTRQAWQLDLPIHLGDETDDVMLRIEHGAARDAADGTPEWAVNLSFRFDTIGTLQCRIALNGERVATTFWCEQTDTRQRLETRLPVLRDALEAQGLEVVHLAGVVGDPPAPLIRVPMPEQLLDERA